MAAEHARRRQAGHPVLATGAAEDDRDPRTGGRGPDNRPIVAHGFVPRPTDPTPYRGPGQGSKARKTGHMRRTHTGCAFDPETLAVTAGRPEREADAPFNPPVVFASTYVGSHRS